MMLVYLRPESCQHSGRSVATLKMCACPVVAGPTVRCKTGRTKLVLGGCIH